MSTNLQLELTTNGVTIVAGNVDEVVCGQHDQHNDRQGIKANRATVKITR